MQAAFELGDQVDRGVVIVKPARISPASPHNDISASLKDRRHPVWLQVGAIAKAYLALYYGDAVKSLAAVFVSQFKVTKALRRQIEGAVHPPHPVFCLSLNTCFTNVRGVNDTDYDGP